MTHDLRPERFGIVANVEETDRFLRTGAKVWIVGGTGGEGWHKFIVYGMTRGGAMAEKWLPTIRLTSFRAAFIPPPIRRAYSGLYLEGTRLEMQGVATALQAFVVREREKKPNRRK